MKTEKALLLFFLVVLFTGCVSSKKHEASLAEIDTLKQNSATLEEQLKRTEEEKRALEVEVPQLKTRIDEIAQERERAISEKEKAVTELTKTYDNLVHELNREIKQGQITITQLNDRLSLSMVDKILFDSGSARIKGDGKKVLDRVGEILKKVTDKQINIEGHTDNVPISSSLHEKFATNWELSTARATNVVRYLQEKAGLDPKMLGAVGHGEFRPVESNETEEGRAKNRRIEIVLVPLGEEMNPGSQTTQSDS